MQITHEEARRLIQIGADRALNTGNKTSLDAHLAGCLDCSGYAIEIKEAEDVLRSAMRKRWNVRPPPLRVEDITAKVISKGRTNALLTARGALIGVTVMLFAFAMWQFASTSGGSTDPATIGTSPVPTPSLLLTSAQADFENCQTTQYEVRPGDTLESVALQFSVSMESIMDMNDLQSEVLDPATQLIIPLCNLTPTSTIQSPTLTTTPALELITYTPG